jgi:flagellar biosynthesis/type III secretory pathway M-ring protein FliF/YscJ
MGPVFEGMGRAIAGDVFLALCVAAVVGLVVVVAVFAVVEIVRRLSEPKRTRAEAARLSAEARLVEARVRLTQAGPVVESDDGRAADRRRARVAAEVAAQEGRRKGSLPTRADGEPITLDKR